MEAGVYLAQLVSVVMISPNIKIQYTTIIIEVTKNSIIFTQYIFFKSFLGK